MSQLEGWRIDTTDALTPEAVAAESERRSRIAYRAWVEACGRTGLNVAKPWEGLIDDEKWQWAAVYGVCARVEFDRGAGVGPMEK